jgi:hypothetical protein
MIMKNLLLLAASLLVLLGLNAQDFPFDDLPEIVRQDMLIEEEDFLDAEMQDSVTINSESGYYKGSARTESTDTIIYSKWHRVDLVWIPVHRLIKTYDAGENMTSSLLQHRRPDGEWMNGVLKTYTYDNDLLSEVLVQFYHGPTQAWYDHFRKFYSYYDDGSLAQIIHQVWYRPGQEWANRFRKVLVYNEDGSLASDTTYLCRPVQQEWIYKHLRQIYYNDLGYKIMQVTSHYVADSSIWKSIHREIYNPDENGLVQDITVQHWCRPMQEWKNLKQILFEYNDAGLSVERLVRYWHRIDSTWVDAHRNLFTYDENDNLDTMIFQRWREGAGIWSNKELNDFEYDAAGTLLSRLTQVWNWELQSWQNFRLMELVIDLKHLAAGTDDPSYENPPEIRLSYPNPYNSSQQVSIAGIDTKHYTITLSDLNGQAVFTRQVTSGQQFRIDADLVPGLYILMVSDEMKLLKSSKMLIMR